MWVKRFATWVNSFNPYNPAALQRDGLRPIQVEEAKIKKSTTLAFIGFFVLFSIWAVWAPLDAGVMLTGTVVAKGSRKAVQHPGGGVVDEIAVAEGAEVQQGDILVRLNPLTLDAELTTTELEYINALTMLSRLLAERGHRSKIDWLPAPKAYKDDTRLQQAMQVQTELFKSRVADFAGQEQIIQEQVRGLRAQLAGSEQTNVERRSQLKMATTEAADLASLAAEGYVPRTSAYQAEARRSELIASIATGQGQESTLQSQILGAQLAQNKLRSAYHADLDERISGAQKALQALESKATAMRHQRSLDEIRAPETGTVVGLKVHTVGGVITPGQVLMEIVPKKATLVVDAQVPAHLIDKVRVGMDVDLRFSAFNLNVTPVIPGKVVRVGADLIAPSSQSPTPTPSQSESYYLVEVETTEQSVKLLGDRVIQTGMPVEVAVKAGERNFLSFVTKPISDRLARAFKGD